jgi:hypothetical protein
MANASAVRRRVADVSRRLVALLDESVTPTNAVQILVAEKLLPAQAGAEPSLPLSSAMESILAGGGIVPNPIARVAEYVRNCESNSRGDLPLRLLGELRIKRARGRTSLGAIGVEFIVLGIVLVIQSIFVLPQLKATFDAVGVPMPEFTRMVFALVGPSGPFLYAGFLALLIVAVWRLFPFLLGPLIRPIDRTLLALPLVGTAMRRSNSNRMSGWLGFSGCEASSQRTVIEAAQAWYQGDLLSRECAAVLRACDAGKEISACLAQARGFDNEFHTAISMSNREDSSAALRARWRAAATLPERQSGMEPALVQVILGVLVAAVVIAMYLPIFKLGSLM